MTDSDHARTPTTAAELYAACRQDVLAEHPNAREMARGLTYVAIMAGKELLGSGSNADRAWADAYGRMTGQRR
jgi:hypothetical protein